MLRQAARLSSDGRAAFFCLCCAELKNWARLTVLMAGSCVTRCRLPAKENPAMTNESRLQKAVKGLGMALVALVVLFVVFFVPLVLLVPYIHGMVWLSEKAFPWLFYGR